MTRSHLPTPPDANLPRLAALALTLTLGLCTALWLPACSRAGGDLEQVDVVATTTIIEDIARRLAGDRLTVRGIMRPGEDPHIYRPRPSDAERIHRARLVLKNGLNLEETLGRIIQQQATGHVVALAEDERIATLEDLEDAAAPDPHCWFNVAYFMYYVENARDALIELDPDNADHYTRRAAEYLQELEQLHAWVAEQIASIPRERRVMVTGHDAFQYFGRAYDIEVHALIGISTEQRPRPQHMHQLETLVRQRGVRALFFETSVNPALNEAIEQIADATGATIGGELYSDSLGGPDSPAPTYIDMVRHNVQTIVKALK